MCLILVIVSKIKINGKQKAQYTLTKDTEVSPSILCFHLLFLNMLLMLWEETKSAEKTHSNTEN